MLGGYDSRGWERKSAVGIAEGGLEGLLYVGRKKRQRGYMIFFHIDNFFSLLFLCNLLSFSEILERRVLERD